MSCIDVSHKQPQTYISAADLDEEVRRSGVDVQRGDILLLYTATFNRLHGTREYLSQYPGLDEAGACGWSRKALRRSGWTHPARIIRFGPLNIFDGA